MKPEKSSTEKSKRHSALPSVNGSALVGLEECLLQRKTPFGITNVKTTQFSIARYYGGIKFNGDDFTYLPDTDELIRDDVLRWRLGQLREALNDDAR